MTKELLFTVRSARKGVFPGEVTFLVDIIDEYTLQVMEKKYPNKLTFDGGRVFTLQLAIPIMGMPEKEPAMWAELLEKEPQLVSAFVLARLKGDI